MSALLRVGALAAAFLLGHDGRIDHWQAGRVDSAPGGRFVPRPHDGALTPDATGQGLTLLVGDREGVLDLGATKNATRLLVTVLEVRRPFSGYLEFGSDDGAAVFLDGVALKTSGVRRGFVADGEMVPVTLAAGTHRLVARVSNNDGPWRFGAHLHTLDHIAPDGVQVVLPVAEPPQPRLVATFDLVPAASPGDGVTCGAGTGPGWRVEVRVELPSGVPVGLPEAPLQVLRDGTPCLDLGPADLERMQHGVSRSVFIPGTTPPSVAQLALVWGRFRASAAPLHADAATLGAYLAAIPTDASTAAQPGVVQRLRQARAAMAVGEAADAAGALAALRRGPTPGQVERFPADVSLDGTARDYVVRLPATLPPAAGYPAIVLLHGFEQDPDSLVRMIAGDSAANGVVIVAPHGYGDIVFRGPGEQDVEDALAFLGARVPLDRSRIWLTGDSMGGMATFELAVRHPDTYAAAAPLCGASDWRLVWSLTDAGLAPWERRLVDARSPAGLAENGPPMFCVHGTADRINALANSVPMVDAYRRLHKPMVFETPPLDHEVWPWVYAQARLMPNLSRHTRDTAPRDVTLLAPSVGLVPARRAWIGVEAVRTVGPPARVEAHAPLGGPIRVTTENVRALRIDVPQGPARIELDRQRFRVNLSGSLRFYLTGTKWATGILPGVEYPGPKRPGLAGPADAVYDQPVRIVYGTGEPGAAAHLRALAERLARYRDGADLSLPVLADVEVTDRAATALVLVGTPAQNKLLAEVLPRLPLRVEHDRIAIGDESARGPTLGAVVGYPDPSAPGRPLLIVTGTDLAGVLLSRHLPELLPDYLIYGPEVATALGGKVLGRRVVRSGGFFGPDWEAPHRAGAHRTP